jgi:hypothetical protein
MSSTEMQVKPKTVVFRSFGEMLILVRKEPTMRVLPNGDKIVDEPPVQYGTMAARSLTNHPLQSKPGGGSTFSVEVGQDEHPTYLGPTERGFEETDADVEDAVSWLRRHPLFNERFFEQPQQEPGAEDVFLEIGQAIAHKDLDKLNELAEFELANWNRERVMEKLRDAYETITEEQPQETPAE